MTVDHIVLGGLFVLAAIILAGFFDWWERIAGGGR